MRVVMSQDKEVQYVDRKSSPLRAEFDSTRNRPYCAPATSAAEVGGDDREALLTAGLVARHR